MHPGMIFINCEVSSASHRFKKSSSERQDQFFDRNRAQSS